MIGDVFFLEAATGAEEEMFREKDMFLFFKGKSSGYSKVLYCKLMS